MSCERAVVGVKVAVFPLRETAPATGPVSAVTVNVVEVTVEGFTASLKVALMGADSAAPRAL